VYRAVEDGEELFSLHASEPSRSCNVGGNIRDVLRPIFCSAHRAMESVLARVSIADIGQEVMAMARAEGCCGDGIDAAQALPARAG
jgi:DNA-binding IscR family transcriptional regulator